MWLTTCQLVCFDFYDHRGKRGTFIYQYFQFLHSSSKRLWLVKAAGPFLQWSLPRVTVDVMLRSRSVISPLCGANLPLSSYVMRWTSVFL